MVPSINGDNMQTIAQQLNIKTFPFEIKVDGNEVYYEKSNGHWYKYKYQDGKLVYHENSDGYWDKREWQDGNEVYYEDSHGCWRKREWQSTCTRPLPSNRSVTARIRSIPASIQVSRCASS